MADATESETTARRETRRQPRVSYLDPVEVDDGDEDPSLELSDGQQKLLHFLQPVTY